MEKAALAHFMTRFQKDFLPQFCQSGTYDSKLTKTDIPILKPDGQDCSYPLEVSLVGHSMGTIIIDRLLHFVPDFEVKNIVFMAAATTLEDYQITITLTWLAIPRPRCFI